MNPWPLTCFTAGAVILALGITALAYRFSPADPYPSVGDDVDL